MTAYRGRFAPSPTGPLHFGSLIAAVASYLDARSQRGEWLIRIEDIDTPRNVPGATSLILQTLEEWGFTWDGEVVMQSTRHAYYEDALTQLKTKHLLYPCGCTRKEIADSALRGVEGVVYPGTCRQGLAPQKSSRAWRVITDDEAVCFVDQVQGKICQHLRQDIGDFVLKRADGLYAYQLAVVVDDAMQNISHVVRGADLLHSTPRQIYLQKLLGLATPEYLHVPVATNQNGEKLSKQTLAEAIDTTEAEVTLCKALDFLGQHTPAELRQATLSEIWQWAITHWNRKQIPATRAMAI